MVFSVANKLLDACVLGVVASGDTYGYDLTQKIGALVDVSESALYPVLRRLQKENLLSTYSQEYDGRMRKYYRITDDGRVQLSNYLLDWKQYQQRINQLLKGESNE